MHKIFSKLHHKNKGLTLLKEIRDILEQDKNQKINISPTYPLPELSILPISIPPIELPIDRQVPQKPEETTILEPNFDPEIYGKLEDFLQKKKWKEADLETMRLMIEIADSIESSNHVPKNRDLITRLDSEDIQKIPDEALKIMDKLWFEYSNGNFGFSVKAKIWCKCKGRPGEFNFSIYKNKFAKYIGWYDGRKWIERYDDFNFSSEAKPGHLPSLSFPDQKNYQINRIRWKETFEVLLPRFFNCGLI
ncbi:MULTISPECIES: GUN4 domain-containing protein [Okeania]|uniref:GUN4 domain-containing protein n=2 Tax=Microcoleaceae TaxID=1892252 RepID=UPI001374FCCD|nr:MULTISPECIES: GUN4 domain-containing protein [Okeania]NET13206.1 GUN4 domain-containing protein [Okeania sp. SIO1H6]NET20741.1 GUN4 domain-containing protein [Okeania sp. SIO1H5]NES77170.1 GUN4 domain-containing protein [Okeania sp. SIO1H4]NES90997.1 GUN4 domain-containing protein [Okeania sp. SIO2B9]NET94356.1 GUN4 domain-containing protein [Okeania sp. SIO1H2]